MRLQLTIKAEKLRKISAFRIGSPFAVATITGGDRNGEEIGRTEVLEDNLNPAFVKILFVESDSSTFMPFRITLQDHGGEEKIMAEANFEMTDVLESPGNRQFEDNHGVVVFAHVAQSQQGESTGSFAFHFRGLDIKNVESGPLGLGRTDPYFEIAKKSADPKAGMVSWIPVYRSEVITDNLNPYWKEACLTLEELCYGDTNLTLKISVWDWQKRGKHRVFCEVETKIGDLQKHLAQHGNADRESAMELHKIGGTKVKGLLVVLKADLNVD